MSGSISEATANDAPSLIPPRHLLIDGSTSAESFLRAGEGFVRAYVIEALGLRPHERVLDLGCGNGGKARVLTTYLDHHGSYEGLDIVPSAVEWCQVNYVAFHNFSFKVADVKSSHYNPTGQFSASDFKFPYRDADFDVVFLCSLFTHMLPDGVANYLREISRVLKPGGRVLATAFLLNPESIAAMAQGRTSRKFVHEIGTCRVLNAQNPHMGVAHDEGWLRRQIVEAGLRTAELTFGLWQATTNLAIASHDIIIMRKPA